MLHKYNYIWLVLLLFGMFLTSGRHLPFEKVRSSRNPSPVPPPTERSIDVDILPLRTPVFAFILSIQFSGVPF
jgi:hypothetical protein